MEKYFKVNGLDIVCRMDYESMPCPMYATEFTDDQMQDLAETIYLALHNGYDYGLDADNYFSNSKLLMELNPYLYEDIDSAFWKEMEDIAVAMGMRYYEDMTDEEYNNIINK